MRRDQKDGRGRLMADYGSGGWGFESLAARHQNPSSAPCRGVVDWCKVAGLRPNCDHVDGHFQPGCDHLRPPWPIPTVFLLISATVASPASNRR
jgi:hypothetical protein